MKSQCMSKGEHKSIRKPSDWLFCNQLREPREVSDYGHFNEFVTDWSSNRWFDQGRSETINRFWEFFPKITHEGTKKLIMPKKYCQKKRVGYDFNHWVLTLNTSYHEITLLYWVLDLSIRATSQQCCQN